ncbi:(1-_4)-alpha-D-glucan 1-alpha-D-glucosylmutase [Catalinimonas alkaloidigena]|uniref:malto-oligosyltrehalose synthase n=1 Tax=Catalinimonas alkaloidigena TaxID=1075417 RepID=UPI002405E600|nr:malto-oligosyltrehalose synthase [Catalinimonas alkaloidigena]MDF9797216.1 (1->4)-alpha-D-glucan 1-alpha-D-glucosylmutase [Catalinimonas alkaloidigena]
MYLPRATYRVQLHKDFNFQQLKEIIPYLDRLGISTIYAAPFFTANPGSMHGYDVLNPLEINPEIGTIDEFKAIGRELKARNMDWLQDIVPNHMALSSNNPWIYDILEKGPHSYYYRFFDINWHYHEEEFFGKLMLPTLGAPLQEVLEAGEIQLKFDTQGFSINYYDHSFPLCMRSYAYLLSQVSELVSKQSEDEVMTKAYFSLAKSVEEFINTLPEEGKKVDGWENYKHKLISLSQKYQAVEEALQSITRDVNSKSVMLSNLLNEQYFRLCHWKITEEKINYRRFFTVNDLICLNMQDQQVFDEYHQLIKRLMDEELIQGLRVDHVDGLLDPTSYLERLRSLVGDDAYIVVEKILEGNELMPAYWPIEGSSGYDYLALSNQVFTNKEGGHALLSQYQKSIADTDYERLVYQNKSFILNKRMYGELDNLFRLMQHLDIIPARDTVKDETKLKEALGHFLIAFPVYRIYDRKLPFSDEALKLLKSTFETAEDHAPELGIYFQRLRDIFNGVDDRDAKSNSDKLYFNMRSQQFTGPLAAKGVEDTTFYQYFPLISHNEVGDTPAHLGMKVEEFHTLIHSRDLRTMNTTATHDTKRGEDTRMRINVVSEIPEVWHTKVDNWRKLNEEFLSKEAGSRLPDKNDEYFLYQTLVGTYPFHISPEADEYPQRLEAYLQKALREAKVHTNWANPNEDYENALLDFAKQIMKNDAFMQDFTSFAKDIALSGAVNSMGQTLLRLTAPGVADTYQGTEYWDLSMVDPDNRRPVNYQEREASFKALEAKWQVQAESLLDELCDDLLHPNIKLFTMYQALNARKQYRPIFDEGKYEAVEVSEAHKNQLLAFRRVTGQGEALVLIPLNTRGLPTKNHLPIGTDCWKDSTLHMGDAQGEWHHLFTNKKMILHEHASVAEILANFPVALLIKD